MVKYTIHLSVHEVKENGRVDELEQVGDTLDFATSSIDMAIDLMTTLMDEGDAHMDGRPHCYPMAVYRGY